VVRKTLEIDYRLIFSKLIVTPITPLNTARDSDIMRLIAKDFDARQEDGISDKIGSYLAQVHYHTNPITSATSVTATAPEIQLSWTT
tara:strand:- start:2230 stop:2490 length:261 start_codon:yes stop_codon:yes gene_type:complete